MRKASNILCRFMSRVRVPRLPRRRSAVRSGAEQVDAFLFDMIVNFIYNGRTWS